MQAEAEILGQLGVPLTPERCLETTGLRIDEAVAHWEERYPWSGPTRSEVVERILDRVLHIITQRAPLKPGVRESLTVVRGAGLRIALASSSSLSLIEKVLDRFGLRAEFEAVVSAEGERFGKPHPGVYLTTAARLGVDPAACLALEDSVNGMLAARAAGMRCIVVPERWPVDPRFSSADSVIPTLLGLTPELLGQFERPR